MREKFAGENDIFVCDSKNSLGFVTMLRLYPKLNFEEQLGFELTHPSSETFDISMCVNNYLDDFFKWDSENRMSQYQGVEYSFSSKYMTLSNGASISAIKLYPSSPHFNKEHALSSAKSIIHQKKVFDLKNRGKYEL